MRVDRARVAAVALRRRARGRHQRAQAQLRVRLLGAHHREQRDVLESTRCSAGASPLTISSSVVASSSKCRTASGPHSASTGTRLRPRTAGSHSGSMRCSIILMAKRTTSESRAPSRLASFLMRRRSQDPGEMKSPACELQPRHISFPRLRSPTCSAPLRSRPILDESDVESCERV